MAKSTAQLKAAPAVAAAPADAGAPPAPRKSRKALYAILVVTFLAGNGGGWYWWTKQQAPAKQAKGAVEPRKPPQFVNLDQFVVNLQDDTTDHYLQTAMALEIANAETSDAIKLYIPIIRNRILMLLTSKQSREIATPEGKQQLAEAILKEVRLPLPVPKDGAADKGVYGVHFSSFVIQ